MEMKRDYNDKSIKVEGDLGNLQVFEEVIDDDDSGNDKQTDPRPICVVPNSSLSTILQPSTSPVLGTVAITNSENVHVGNNTYFNGNVTIIQSKFGMENASYSKTEDDGVQNEESQAKSKLDTSKKKHEILTWHKLTFSALCVVVVGGIFAIILVLRFKTEENGTLPTYHISDTSANTTVVVLNYDIFPVVLISIIMLPVTLLLMFSYYLLLTQLMNYPLCDEEVNHKIKKNESDGINSTDKCMQFNAKEYPLLIAPGHLRIVSRTDWLAQPVEGTIDKIKQPVPWVIITHTATESCETQSECVLKVRLIQSFHIESREWFDIGYNFLVGGDGSVYYGRGWDYIGAHTKGYNKYSIGIAFIGTFNKDSPTKRQVEACQKIIQQGVDSNKLKKDYFLFAHRQLMSTLSPGDKVVDIIKQWPHYVHNLTDVYKLLPKDY